MVTFTLPHRVALLAWILFVASGAANQSRAQSRLLDDFESPGEWKPIASEGAKLSLHGEVGKTGNALSMDFDLSKVAGFVGAERDLSISLPSDYQFTFDLRGDAPVNNFEFKLIDDKENVYWIKKLNVRFPQEWTHQRIRKRQISIAWGPSRGKNLIDVRRIEFVVSCGTGGVGRVAIDNFRFEPIDDSVALTARARIIGKDGVLPSIHVVQRSCSGRRLLQRTHCRSISGIRKK